MYHYTCILSLIIALPGALIAMNPSQSSASEAPFLVIHDYQIRALIEKPAQQYTPLQDYQKLLDALLTSPQVTAAHFKSMENISSRMLLTLKDTEIDQVALNYFEANFKTVLEAILELPAIQAPKNYVAESRYNETLARAKTPGALEETSTLIASNGIIALRPLLARLSAILAKAMNPRTLLDHLNAHKYNISNPPPPPLTNIFKPQWFVVISLGGTTNTQATIKIVVKPYADYQRPGTQTHDSQDETEELAKVFDAASLNDSNRQQPISSLQTTLPTIAPSTSSTTLPTTPTTSIKPPPASITPAQSTTLVPSGAPTTSTTLPSKITPAASTTLVPAGAPATQIQSSTPATNSQQASRFSGWTSYFPSLSNPFARPSQSVTSSPQGQPSTTPTSQTHISSESSSNSSSSSSSPTPAPILPGPTPSTPSSVATSSNHSSPTPSTGSSVSSSPSPTQTLDPNPTTVKQEVHAAAPLPDSSVNDVEIVEKQISKTTNNAAQFSAPPPSDNEKITTILPPTPTSTPPTSVVYATPTSQKELKGNSTSDESLPISLISQSSGQQSLSSGAPLTPDNDSGPAPSSPAAKSPYSELQDSLQNSDLAFNQNLQEVRALKEKLKALSLEQPQESQTPSDEEAASLPHSSIPELEKKTEVKAIEEQSQKQATPKTSPQATPKQSPTPSPKATPTPSPKASPKTSKTPTPENRSRSNSTDQSSIPELATETDKGKVDEQSQQQTSPKTSPQATPKQSPTPSPKATPTSSKTPTPEPRSRSNSTNQSSTPELEKKTEVKAIEEQSQKQPTPKTSPQATPKQSPTLSPKTTPPPSKTPTPENRSRSNSTDQSSTPKLEKKTEVKAIEEQSQKQPTVPTKPAENNQFTDILLEQDPDAVSAVPLAISQQSSSSQIVPSEAPTVIETPLPPQKDKSPSMLQKTGSWFSSLTASDESKKDNNASTETPQQTQESPRPPDENTSALDKLKFWK